MTVVTEIATISYELGMKFRNFANTADCPHSWMVLTKGPPSAIE